METFSALQALCEGNSPVTDEFPTQRPVTRSFDVFFDLWLNKRVSKQPWCWWFETPSCSIWRHCNVDGMRMHHMIGSKYFMYPDIIEIARPSKCENREKFDTLGRCRLRTRRICVFDWNMGKHHTACFTDKWHIHALLSQISTRI